MKNHRKALFTKTFSFLKDVKIFHITILIFLLFSGLFFRIDNLSSIGDVSEVVNYRYLHPQKALDLGYENRIEGDWGILDLFRKIFSFSIGYLEYWNYENFETRMMPLELLLSMVFVYFGNLIASYIGTSPIQTYIFLIRFSNIFVDISIAIIIFLLAIFYAKSKKEIALYLPVIFFALPISWLHSGLLGDFENLAILLLIFGVGLIYKGHNQGLKTPLYKDRRFLSGVFLGISILIKPFAIILLPLIISFHFWNKKSEDVSRFLLLILGMSLATISIIFFSLYFISINANYLYIQISAMIFLGGIYIFTYLESFRRKSEFINLYRQFLGLKTIVFVFIILIIFINPISFLRMISGNLFLVNNNLANQISMWSLFDLNLFNASLIEFGFVNVSGFLVGFLSFIIIFLLILLRFQGIKMSEISYRLMKSNFVKKVFGRRISISNFFILSASIALLWILLAQGQNFASTQAVLILLFIAISSISSRKSWLTIFLIILPLSFGYFISQIYYLNFASTNIKWIGLVYNSFKISPLEFGVFIVFCSAIGLLFWVWRYCNPNSSLLDRMIH
jgi:hypothetical protein